MSTKRHGRKDDRAPSAGAWPLDLAEPMSQLRRLYLGWRILEASCALTLAARELGDKAVVARLDAIARRAADIVGAPHALVARIVRGKSGADPSTVKGRPASTAIARTGRA